MILKVNYYIKQLLFLTLSLTAIISCSKEDDKEPETNQVTEPIINTPVASSTWNLIFEDNFNNGLTLWNIWEGGAFNEEIQLYKPEQLSIENNTLNITTKRETASGSTTIFDTTPKSFEYVSGRIESDEVFGPSDIDGEREYRFLASIKLPSGTGIWPAFWTYGDPWPTQGEIDILEARGQTPEEFQSNIFYGTTANSNINYDTEVIHNIGQNLTTEFHTYEMIWKANSIEIIFDEESIYTYTTNDNNNISELLGKKQRIVLNTAVGGHFFTDRNSDNYADNATMEIEWVRVYKR